MNVLDDEEHRLLLAERLDQRQQRLEDARLRRLRGARALAQAWQDHAERGRQGSGKSLERGVLVAKQRPQRGDQGRVGQLALAEIDAIAREHDRAVAHATDQLLNKA